MICQWLKDQFRNVNLVGRLAIAVFISGAIMAILALFNADSTVMFIALIGQVIMTLWVVIWICTDEMNAPSTTTSSWYIRYRLLAVAYIAMLILTVSAYSVEATTQQISSVEAIAGAIALIIEVIFAFKHVVRSIDPNTPAP